VLNRRRVVIKPWETLVSVLEVAERQKQYWKDNLQTRK